MIADNPNLKIPKEREQEKLITDIKNECVQLLLSKDLDTPHLVSIIDAIGNEFRDLEDLYKSGIIQ